MNLEQARALISLEEAVEQLALARTLVVVPPYARVNEYGNVEHVDAYTYWREWFSDPASPLPESVDSSKLDVMKSQPEAIPEVGDDLSKLLPPKPPKRTLQERADLAKDEGLNPYLVTKTYGSNDVQVVATAETCPKCGGSGILPQYLGIDNGRCWTCAGSGVVYERYYAPDERAYRNAVKFQKEAAAAVAAAAKADERDKVVTAKREKFLADNPDIAEWCAYLQTRVDQYGPYDGFFKGGTDYNVYYNLFNEGELSGFYLKSARSEIEKWKAPAWQPGKQEVVGTILVFKTKDTQWGTQFKMMLGLEDGRRLWVTRPNSLKAEVGDTIVLKANVTPSDDDPGFGFGKNPSIVQDVEESSIPETGEDATSHWRWTANFSPAQSPAKDRRNYVAKLLSGDAFKETYEREFLKDAWVKVGEQDLSSATGKRIVEQWAPIIPVEPGLYEVQVYRKDPRDPSKDQKSRQVWYRYPGPDGFVERIEDYEEIQKFLEAVSKPAEYLLRGKDLRKGDHIMIEGDVVETVLKDRFDDVVQDAPDALRIVTDKGERLLPYGEGVRVLQEAEVFDNPADALLSRWGSAFEVSYQWAQAAAELDKDPKAVIPEDARAFIEVVEAAEPLGRVVYRMQPDIEGLEKGSTVRFPLAATGFSIGMVVVYDNTDTWDEVLFQFPPETRGIVAQHGPTWDYDGNEAVIRGTFVVTDIQYMDHPYMRTFGPEAARKKIYVLDLDTSIPEEGEGLTTTVASPRTESLVKGERDTETIRLPNGDMFTLQWGDSETIAGKPYSARVRLYKGNTQAGMIAVAKDGPPGSFGTKAKIAWIDVVEAYRGRGLAAAQARFMALRMKANWGPDWVLGHGHTVSPEGEKFVSDFPSILPEDIQEAMQERYQEAKVIKASGGMVDSPDLTQISPPGLVIPIRELRKLLALGRIWVPPYPRINEEGNREDVDGYWREVAGDTDSFYSEETASRIQAGEVSPEALQDMLGKMDLVSGLEGRPFSEKDAELQKMAQDALAVRRLLR